MSTESFDITKECRFKIGDKVKRKKGNGGPGVVIAINNVKEDASKTKKPKEELEEELLVTVQWFNGTQSIFTPTALEKLQ